MPGLLLGKNKEKGLAALIVGGLPGPDSDSKSSTSHLPDDDEDPNAEGLKAAADEIMEAMKERDSDMLVTAMKSFMVLSASKPEEEEQTSHNSEHG